MKHLFVIPAVVLGLALGAGKGLAQTSGCPICDCNTSAARCVQSCQSTSDFVKRQQCEISCNQSFSKCLTAAYAAISAAEKAAQTTSTSTTSTTTTTASTAASTSTR